MSDATRTRAVTKRPSTFDEHIPGSISGDLKDGAELALNQAVREYFTCAGVARLRVRFMATVGGTLRVRFLRSIVNKNIEYPTAQPDDTAVAPHTEAIADIQFHYGEGRGYVEFVPSADGNVEYCDLLMT